jgi:uracil-DNA glycosylase
LHLILEIGSYMNNYDGQTILKLIKSNLEFQVNFYNDGIPLKEIDFLFKTSVSKLDDIREELGDCKRCKLHPSRKNIVFGDGNTNASLVFVGEAPGADEDEQGLPFVGKAGKLLTKIIEAINMKRQDVYICNILKCRPPGNRNPEEDEIKSCVPFLKKQLLSINPQVICTLGTFSAQTLLNVKTPISNMRGKVFYYNDICVIPTYHPAFLLRNPNKKKDVWEDVKMIRDILKG